MHTETPEAIAYVKSSIAAGHTTESIWLAMLQEGWALPELLQLFKDAGAQVKYPINSVNKTHIPISRVLLGIGALIVVIAGVIYIGTSWKEWGAPAKVMAIFLPMVIMFAIGIPGWFRQTTHKNSIAFLFVGAMLFPMFVLILLTQYGWLVNDYNILFLVLFGSTLVLYIILFYVFPSSIWSLLAAADGIFTYYFVLAALGVINHMQSNLIPWLFILPAGLYIIIAMHLETIKKDKEIASYFYFGGLGILITAMYVLALTGGLVFMRTMDLENRWAIAGWSTVGVGALFILFAWLTGKAQLKGFTLLGRYEGLFHLIGPFTILAAVFVMGTNGIQPVYETLVLALSIACIAISTWWHRQAYLFVGCLALVVYIFSTGSEYFSDAIGWPITLFIAGILSMGVGYLMERLRKAYKAPMVAERKA